MASQYLATLDEYKERSVLPAEYIDQVEARYPGWVLQQIEDVSTLDIDGRLAKRYAVPFGVNPPPAVKVWIARMMDPRVLIKRGVDAQDPEAQELQRVALTCLDQIKEAADAENGLFDLPLATGASGIVRGLPKAHANASPYEAVYSRDARARREDGGC